jgi:hypothetical protein
MKGLSPAHLGQLRACMLLEVESLITTEQARQIANEDALDELADFADSLSPVYHETGKSARRVVPVRLSKTRILDIVLWADLAIHDEHHMGWSRRYADEVASRV